MRPVVSANVTVPSPRVTVTRSRGVDSVTVVGVDAIDHVVAVEIRTPGERHSDDRVGLDVKRQHAVGRVQPNSILEPFDMIGRRARLRQCHRQRDCKCNDSQHLVDILPHR
jgi:hypothetical protein